MDINKIKQLVETNGYPQAGVTIRNTEQIIITSQDPDKPLAIELEVGDKDQAQIEKEVLQKIAEVVK